MNANFGNIYCNLDLKIRIFLSSILIWAENIAMMDKYTYVEIEKRPHRDTLCKYEIAKAHKIENNATFFIV